jgi:hypothetical protein
MGDERRRHQRVAADFPFRFVNEQGEEEAFDLLDLSESGARIQCGRQLAAMTRVQVGLVLPGHRLGQEEDVRVVTTGVVVWSHQVADGRFDTGVFFSELEDAQRDTLRSFVQASA